MYDSVIYGYGLTLSLLSRISKVVEALDINSFIEEFTDQNSNYYESYKVFFSLNEERTITFNECFKALKKNKERIKKYGFERWVSKFLFNGNTDNKLNVFVYILHNFWYSNLLKNISNSQEYKKTISNYASVLNNTIKNSNQIYTTNFDTFLDQKLKVNHLHGKFIIPFKNSSDVILFNNGDNYEYKYLFASNGYEKLIRLAKINQTKNKYYDLEFFSNENIDLGDLLIWGLSFGESLILNKIFLKQYPTHKNFYIVRSVDGHILNRLKQKYERNKLRNITISYHSENEFLYLKKLLKTTEFNQIIKYKHSSELINFAT